MHFLALKAECISMLLDFGLNYVNFFDQRNMSEIGIVPILNLVVTNIVYFGFLHCHLHDDMDDLCHLHEKNMLLLAHYNRRMRDTESRTSSLIGRLSILIKAAQLILSSPSNLQFMDA